MNRINPLYVGILAILLLLFFTLKLATLQESLKNEKRAYKETLGVATNLQGLKAAYADKMGVRKSINRLLRQRILKSANIEKKLKSKGLVLSAKSVTLQQLNFFMGKIVNGSYKIGLLKIKRISKERASFRLEIQW